VALFAAAPSLQAQTASYDVLDNVEGEWVSTNAVPIRPMAVTAAGSDIYAVSTQANTVVHFALAGGSTRFATPRSPVSVALWDHDTMDATPESRLLVVCRDSYVLAVLDRLTGETLAVLELRDPGTARILAEPQDILVDQAANRAFVSCAGVDKVAEIDLTGPTVVRTFHLPAKNPVFMAFDANKDVLVAPMLSGNNSGSRKNANDVFDPQHQGPTVVDFAAQALNGTRLPDEDLFRCIRSSGTVQAVTRDVGTVQFGVGVHPTSGKVWQLNTEANNKDPNRQGIRAVQGDFARNRVSIATLPGTGGSAATPFKIVDLDTTDALNPYDPTRTVGQPYALTFAGSLGVITGLLTDNVMVLSKTGNFVLEFDLPDGSIPRGVVFEPNSGITLVYCWGTNRIEGYITNLTAMHVVSLDLGFDPAPDVVKEGRELFYDARFSERNNLSCATCHVEARTDMVIWDLSDLPTDDKGPMLTQSMAGIEKLVPLHWRGEQLNGLIDFNGAFTALHGAARKLNATEFSKFEAYTFSVQNSPNPFQNESRLLDDAIKANVFPGSPVPRATVGQALFQSKCESCHNRPIGTSNALHGDANNFHEQNPRRQRTKVAPFHGLYRREQDADLATPGIQTVSITLPSLTGGPDETMEYAPLGAGFSHAGLSVALHAFVLFFAGTQQELSDVTGFVFQWDQGLAPATYRATLLDSASHATASLVLANYLVPQANARNCDIVVYGKSTIDATLQPMRWFYDRSLAKFVAEDSTVANQPLSFFTTQAQAGQGSNVFMGVPVGMGERIGIDYDGDDLRNLDETLVWGTNPFTADADGDGWTDGHEVNNGGNPTNLSIGSNDTTDPTIVRAVTQFVTGRVARINVQTDEPTTVRVAYFRSGGPPQSKSTTVFSKTHSILLDDLMHSTGGNPWHTYNGNVIVKDQAGRTAKVGLPTMPSYNLGLAGSPPAPITTRGFGTSPADVVIGDLEWDVVGRNRAGKGVTAFANVRVDRVTGGPPVIAEGDVHVIARLFKNNVQVTNFQAVGDTRKLSSFNWMKEGVKTPFTGLPGPFLLSSMTDAGGETRIGFSLGSAKPGDELLLNIELVVEQNGAFTKFTAKDIKKLVWAGTKAEFRHLPLKL
jgi:hypothetical protein